MNLEGAETTSLAPLAGGFSGRQALALSAVLAALATTYLHSTIGQQVASPPIDSYWYRMMAAGGNAAKPFGNRVLAPFVVRLAARLTGCSLDQGFYALGLTGIWALLCGVLMPVLRRKQAVGLCLAILPMFFWQDLFRNYFLPDLPHAALLAIFFLMLRARWWYAAAAMLLPLYLARESTLLVSLIAVPVVWRLVGRGTGLLFLVFSLLGVGASKSASRHALPNIHHLDDTLYLMAKVPWNFSQNVLGLHLWANTFVDEPIPPHVWRLPPSLHLGTIHAVGYYPPSLHAPLQSLMILLLLFGLGPCAVLCLLYRVPWRRLLPPGEPYLWVAAIYGAVAYLLAPSLGASLFRLVGYGWPLFFIYLPAMLPRVWTRWRVWQVACLLGAHWLPCWLIIRGSVRSAALQVAIVLLADALGAILLLRQTTAEPQPVYDGTPDKSPV